MIIQLGLLIVAFTCIMLSIPSCNENAHVRSFKVKIDDSTYVQGPFADDSLYNGTMRFYNSNDSVLCEADYKFGLLDGIRKDFYLGGIVSSKSIYKNGLLHGESMYFDTHGTLVSSRNYYYGLIVGSSAEYFNGSIKNYYFYSLNYEPIFQLHYDPRNPKEITELEDDYFFIRKDTCDEIINGSVRISKTRVFLYLLNPPEYDFKYRLVYVDEKNKVKSVVKNLGSGNPWSEFLLEDYVTDDSKLAIELKLKDSIFGGRTTMLKIIN
jgi:hypothetical protein